jgi:glycosyltransferase involved in cell wall biosynthesis
VRGAVRGTIGAMIAQPNVALARTAPRIALVHDWLNQLGGAENVLEELVSLFPGAPIYTSMYAADAMPDAYRRWDIRTTFMQRLPGVAHHHQKYLPVYPLAFERTDLSDYDLVLSNKSGFCHGVRTTNHGRKAVHVCYCLTPTRFLWLFDQYREREQLNAAASALLRPVLAQLRRWDYAAAQRVDHFIAISSEIQRRIRDIYHRESVIIHPPVDTDYFRPAQQPAVGDYYLIVGRLIPYKRIDLAVQAFAHLPQEKLIVVGDGRDRAALAAAAPPNVAFRRAAAARTRAGTVARLQGVFVSWAGGFRHRARGSIERRSPCCCLCRRRRARHRDARRDRRTLPGADGGEPAGGADPLRRPRLPPR